MLEQICKFDYWGPPPPTRLDNTLHHVIFLRFKDDANAAAVKAVENGFIELADLVDEIKAFEWGRNVSTEGLDDGFTHCFIVTFDSEAGRAAYHENADHWKFVEVLAGSMAKARVVDFFSRRPSPDSPGPASE